VLVAAAVVIGWLLLFALLSRIDAHLGVDAPPPDAGDPPPDTPQPPAEPADDVQPSSNIFSLLAFSTVLLMMAVFVGAVIAGRRQRRRRQPTQAASDGEPAAAATSAPDPLARAAEVGLAEAGDLSREPREAIIACYAAMERELTHVPGAVPQDCDTPSEVLARAVDNRALRADSATELVELFEEARFSPHVMSEAHRDAAVSVLERVLAELPDGAARSIP
jgi:uncharacterized protein DUF4129